MATPPATSHAPIAPIATPTFRRYVRSDSSSIQIITVETSQPVVLSKRSDAQRDGAVSVLVPDAADFDLELYADSVTLVGDIALHGRTLTLVANRLTVEASDPGSKGPVSIDVSGGRGDPRPDPPAAGCAESQKVGGKSLAESKPHPTNGRGRTIIKVLDDQGNYHYALQDLEPADGSRGWSASDQPLMHGQPVLSGDAGHAGGTITLAVGELSGLAIELNADGGAGGDGQNGQNGMDGGDGGAGADAVWIDDIVGHSTAASNGGAAGHGGNAGPGGQGGSGGKPGTIIVHVARGGESITTSLRWGQPGSDGAPGKPGAKGARGALGQGYKGAYNANLHDRGFLDLVLKDGAAGDPTGDADGLPDRKVFTVRGQPWYGQAMPVVNPDMAPDHFELAATQDTLAGYASVGWLHLMLERIRVEYFKADPARHPDAFAAVGDRLTWLVSTLSALKAALKAQPGQTLLDTTFTGAWALAQRHASGLDAFGMQPSWVPTLSVSSLLQRGKETVLTLQNLEAKGKKFWLSAATGTVNTDGLAIDAAEIGSAITKLDEDIETAKSDITTARTGLEKADATRKAAMSDLKTALDNFKDAVMGAFSLNPETLLNCLSQMAFAGGPGGLLLVGSQAGLAAIDTVTNIRDNAGQPVNKDYLLGQLTSFVGKSWELAVTENASGFVAKDGSYRFLDDLARIRGLIDSFSQTKGIGDAGLKAAKQLDDFVDVVDQRNSFVDKYNESVRRAASLQADRDHLQATATSISNRQAATADGGMSAWADYLDRLAGRVRDSCLDDLARAYRAAAFWNLGKVGSFQAWLGGNPGAIESSALDAAFDMLKQDLTDAVAEARKTPNVFPASAAAPASEWLPGGVLVVLEPGSHPAIFRQLTRCGWAELEILPAAKSSQSPATHETPTGSVRAVSAVDVPADVADESLPPVNPFHGKANVRLSRVRVWIEGMKTSNGTHSIAMQQCGPERLRTAADEPFPAASAGRYLDHDSILTVNFAYDATEYGFDSNRGFRAAALSEGFDTSDGNLAFNQAAAEAGAVLPVPSTYAPIGPFGVWRLCVDPNDNPNLDLTQVRRIIIDFQGWFDHFV
jgi:hypothetical protein